MGHFDEIDAKTDSRVDWQARIKTKGNLGPVHPREPDRAGRYVRLAFASRAELVDRQVRGADPVPRRRPDLHGQVIEAGHGFVDNGGDVHVVRNEGTVLTVVYVSSLVPAGFERRIDQPKPDNCTIQ